SRHAKIGHVQYSARLSYKFARTACLYMRVSQNTWTRNRQAAAGKCRYKALRLPVTWNRSFNFCLAGCRFVLSLLAVEDFWIFYLAPPKLGVVSVGFGNWGWDVPLLRFLCRV